MPKSVDFTIPITNPIRRCCAQATDQMQAIPTFRQLPNGGVDVGYILESQGCACPSRWLSHDWQEHGHAQFIRFDSSPLVQ